MESSRSRNHRQSALLPKATHTGFPNAPARWAMEVSLVMTKSRFMITAAVSMNGAEASNSGPKSTTANGISLKWSTPLIF